MREKYLNFILQLLRKVAQNHWDRGYLFLKGKLARPLSS